MLFKEAKILESLEQSIYQSNIFEMIAEDNTPDFGHVFQSLRDDKDFLFWTKKAAEAAE